MTAKPFHVSAGKYHDHERTCSYCNSFATLDEAIADYDKVSGYPWAEIQYKGVTFQPYASED